ncbi:hypothetical protein [Streptomyces sp. NPDC002104]
MSNLGRTTACLAAATAGVIAFGATLASATTSTTATSPAVVADSNGFPTGKFKIRNKDCLARGLDKKDFTGISCDSDKVYVWTYKPETRQLVNQEGKCMGRYENFFGLQPGTADCADDAADQRWVAGRNSNGYTFIYHPTVKMPFDQDNQPEVLWMFKTFRPLGPDDLYTVEYRKTHHVYHGEAGFTLLPVA